MNFEDDILSALLQSPETRYSAKQLGRMLDRELFREDPNWLRPSLELMVMKRQIQCDAQGYWFQAQEPKRQFAALAA